MKKMKKFLGIMLAMVMAVTMLAGCGGSSKESSSSDNGKTLKFGCFSYSESLDPANMINSAWCSSRYGIGECLFKYKDDLSVENTICDEYSTEDNKTWVFHIRDGVKFSNGNDVTPSAIKACWDVLYANKTGSSNPSKFMDYESITPDDDARTLTIVLKQAKADLRKDLAYPVFVILDVSGDYDLAENPIGTGPFKITNFAEGQYLEMERYDGYWNKELDCIQHAKFKFIADAQSAFVELQGGTIDMLQYLTNDQVAALGTENYNIVESTMMLVHGLFLNNAYEPLKDVRVRQALNYAVDRDAINEFLFGGKSKIIQTHGYPTITAWYNADTEGTYTYDVDKAKELLAEAGYADGFDLEITVPSSYTQHVQTAEIIAEQLAAVGVNVTINQVEWSSWVSDVYQGRDYQSTVIGFDISSLSPATWYKRYYTDSSNDFTNFSDASYDEVYGKALATIDHDEKHQLYGELQQILTDQAASVFIEDPADFIAVSNKYTGYQSYPVSAIDLSLVKPVQ